MNHRVKEIRKALGLSGEDFGQILGITRGAVSNIENGNRKLTEQTTKLICREFNVNEEWLRTGKGEMFIEMDEDDKLAEFFGGILNPNTNPTKKMIIQTIAHISSMLTDEQWSSIGDYIDNLLKDKEKD